jgi:adenine-specific DNA methylase
VTFDDAMVSPWNSRRTAATAFMALIERLPARYVCVSYNDESLVPLATLETLLRARWPITVHSIAYRRNVMCKIGNAATTAGPKKEDNTEVLIWIDKSGSP